jgi:hypothetical protein
MVQAKEQADGNIMCMYACNVYVWCMYVCVYAQCF